MSCLADMKKRGKNGQGKEDMKAQRNSCMGKNGEPWSRGRQECRNTDPLAERRRRNTEPLAHWGALEVGEMSMKICRIGDAGERRK